MWPESVIESLSEWRVWAKGRLTSVPQIQSRLNGGLTNQSYLLNSSMGKLVLRMNRPDAEKLGINRAREALILQQLNQQVPGVAPELIYFDAPQYRYLVYQYVEGRCWSQKDLKYTHKIQMLEAVIQQYQQVNLSIEPRNYRQYLYHYWQQLESAQVLDRSIRQQWQAFQPTLERLYISAHDAQLCHHDMIVDNIIETEVGLTIIDWEYAHLGHADLDWVNISELSGCQSSNRHCEDMLQLIQWLNRLWTMVVEL